MSRDSPRSERDGAKNTRIQTGSGCRSVIPYVLCGGLYSLWYCSMAWRGLCLPLYSPEEHSYMESPNRIHLGSYSEWVGQFPYTQASPIAVRVITVEVGCTHAVLPTLEYSAPVSCPAAPDLTHPFVSLFVLDLFFYILIIFNQQGLALCSPSQKRKNNTDSSPPLMVECFKIQSR